MATSSLRPWQRIIPEADRAVYDKAGYGKPQVFGQRPVLLIVDVVYSFVGSRPMSTAEAIAEYRTSCGEAGWEALPRIRELLEAARAHGVPVVYTKGDPEYKEFCGGSTKGYDPGEIRRIHSTDIPEMISPRPGELVIRKTKASAFFATPLPIYLNRLQADTLLVCGTSTSGCVRATVVDGYSYGYPVFVVEEACFDRSQFSHLVNLYEMNNKYADVITLEDALGYLRRLHPAHDPVQQSSAASSRV